MKKMMFLALCFGCLSAHDCEDADEDECCPKYDYNEVDHSYLRDEADWPTKMQDPLMDALKN